MQTPSNKSESYYGIYLFIILVIKEYIIPTFMHFALIVEVYVTSHVMAGIMKHGNFPLKLWRANFSVNFILSQAVTS